MMNRIAQVKTLSPSFEEIKSDSKEEAFTSFVEAQYRNVVFTPLVKATLLDKGLAEDGEDWPGLKTALENLSSEDFQELIEVLSNTPVDLVIKPVRMGSGSDPYQKPTKAQTQLAGKLIAAGKFEDLVSKVKNLYPDLPDSLVEEATEENAALILRFKELKDKEATENLLDF